MPAAQSRAHRWREFCDAGSGPSPRDEKSERFSMVTRDEKPVLRNGLQQTEHEVNQEPGAR